MASGTTKSMLGEKPLLIHQQLESAFGKANLPSAGQEVTLSVDPASVTLFEHVTPYEAEERV